MIPRPDATLDELLDGFTTTACKFEGRPAYKVGGEEAQRLDAWRHHLPRPVRSVSTNAFLARIALTTAVTAPVRKSWTRVRTLDTPLTEYQRYGMASLLESQAAGEDVLVVDRAALARIGDLPDFWLFDHLTDAPFAAVSSYSRDGVHLGREVHTDPGVIAQLAAVWDEVLAAAAPLNVYLAGHADVFTVQASA